MYDGPVRGGEPARPWDNRADRQELEVEPVISGESLNIH
jgi:hypothetical protein